MPHEQQIPWPVQLRQQQVSCFSDLHCEARIDDIGTRESQVNEPGGFPNGFARRSQKRYEIVVGLEFNFMHPIQIAGRASDHSDGVLGYDPALAPGFADGFFHLEPAPDLATVGPEAPMTGRV